MPGPDEAPPRCYRAAPMSSPPMTPSRIHFPFILSYPSPVAKEGEVRKKEEGGDIQQDIWDGMEGGGKMHCKDIGTGGRQDRRLMMLDDEERVRGRGERTGEGREERKRWV